MANLLERLKAGFVAAMDSNRHAEKTELAYLRELYTGSGAPQRNQFYQLVSESGNVVGYEWVCACGTSYQMLSVNDWLGKTHVCPACKVEFDLFKFARITAEDSEQQKREKLSKLPVRPRLAGKRTPGAIDTWGNDDCAVAWDGAKPVGGVKHV